MLYELRRILRTFGFCVFASGLLFLTELVQLRRGVVWMAAGGLILFISEFLPDEPAPKRGSPTRKSGDFVS